MTIRSKIPFPWTICNFVSPDKFCHKLLPLSFILEWVILLWNKASLVFLNKIPPACFASKVFSSLLLLLLIEPHSHILILSFHYSCFYCTERTRRWYKRRGIPRACVKMVRQILLELLHREERLQKSPESHSIRHRQLEICSQGAKWGQTSEENYWEELA